MPAHTLDPDLVYYITSGNQLYAWDPVTGQEIYINDYSSAGQWGDLSVLKTPDGDLELVGIVYSGSGSCDVYRFNTESGSANDYTLIADSPSTGTASSLTPSPDGIHLYYTSFTTTPQGWTSRIIELERQTDGTYQPTGAYTDLSGVNVTDLIYFGEDDTGREMYLGLDPNSQKIYRYTFSDTPGAGSLVEVMVDTGHTIPRDAFGFASVGKHIYYFEGSGQAHKLTFNSNGTVATDTIVDTVFLPSGTQVYGAGAAGDSTGAPCFTKGTLIRAEAGDVPVETLRPGDLVLTRDNGYQPVRWVGARVMGVGELRTNPKLAPVRIEAGALGPGMPGAPLEVSPQHRVLVSSRVARRLTGREEVLIPAIKLLGLPGVRVVTEAPGVTYFHILFDRHEVIWSNAAPTESLYLGRFALAALSPEARAEIAAIFPDFLEGKITMNRPEPESGRVSRNLVAHHVRNGRPVLEILAPQTISVTFPAPARMH
ncbi:Hint domain-containing protein [Rhodovulum imhoffii]|uniref:Hint domain-containing protein n=1 Tax=Rhodovulum imhoffii TaxID=365340 RepID=A0A2T5BS06_9RHOB|nr:Hint domain-containing protein [Rhodovulum imhoffii]PTN02092.1 Hint domain-containing protein [Rhodovulum imhoffii]